MKLYKHLQKKRRFRYPRIKRRRQTIANSRKTPIKERDEEINQRKTFGHWEGDLIIFKKTKTNLFTLRERKSRLILAIKNPSRNANATANTLIKYMKNNIHKTMQSLTLDNDVAFAYHEKLANSMNVKIYFCDPYKSYQKGSIENANRVLRMQLPRETEIDFLGQNNIDKIVRQMNNRPMKCLNYQTPNEVFNKVYMSPTITR